MTKLNISGRIFNDVNMVQFPGDTHWYRVSTCVKPGVYTRGQWLIKRDHEDWSTNRSWRAYKRKFGFWVPTNMSETTLYFIERRLDELEGFSYVS